MPHAELLIVGGGPGGYTAAFRAADLGMEVTLIERYDRLGGVCLNVGCIPSKILLHVAETIAAAESLKQCGVDFGAPAVNFREVNRFKDGTVGKLAAGLSALAERRKIRLVRGEAAFTSSSTVEYRTVSGKVQAIGFDQAIIAAGSRPRPAAEFDPQDPRLKKRLMDSTGALKLARVPENMLIVGGGVIGLEMACAYEAFGTRITLIEAENRLMTECDRDLVQPLEQRLKKRGVEIFVNMKIGTAKGASQGLRVVFSNGAKRTFDSVLTATGRIANSDVVGAVEAGVKLDERGSIPTDAQQRTNVETLFAVGDVTGPPLLAHKAMHQGKVAAETAAGHPAAFDARVIPAVAYTNPEIAWAGLSQTEAERRGVPVQSGVFPWSANGRALSADAGEGLTKILRDPASKRIIGAGIVGRNAGELIAEMALAIEMGAETHDVAATIHPHPTLSETLGAAAEVLEKTVTDL